MEIENQFSAIAALLAEPARATMLWNLSDGRAYTAGELAVVSGISPQSASNHLNKLVEADFLKMEKQGKHRYYRFARAEVAYAVEAIANLMPGKTAIREQMVLGNGDMQYCRTCYDHLAGKIAVDLTQSLIKQKILQLEGNRFIIGSKGKKWFETLGIDLDEIRKCKRNFARPCLDWTERKYHISGSLGAALFSQMKNLHWIRSKMNSRIVILTAKGEGAMQRLRLI
jgi:DNA-binding transcriptional ArsR family regulator